LFIYEVGLDEGAADVTFAGLAGGHAAIGEDEASHAVGREVVDEALRPGVVGVARGRLATDPENGALVDGALCMVRGDHLTLQNTLFPSRKHQDFRGQKAKMESCARGHRRVVMHFPFV